MRFFRLKSRGTVVLVTIFFACGVSNVASFIVTKIAQGRTSRLFDSSSDEFPPIVVSPRKRQVRRKPSQRRSAYYWTDSDNVRQELRWFWEDLNVRIPGGRPPPIPNESVLNHFERHNLRAAISSHGGREELSEKLGGSTIMAGKWSLAVQTSPELRQLLANATNGLTPDLPPLSPQQLKEGEKYNSSKQIIVPKEKGGGTATFRTDEIFWSRNQPGRKPHGSWNLPMVIEELYKYVDECQTELSRPAVWMPRPSEMEARGRRDLKLAMYRVGGSKKVCKIAGLVPYKEWHYFEGQLELMVELKAYLQQHQPGDSQTFPSAIEMKHNGHEHLYRLVQNYGGKKYLANILGMTGGTGSNLHVTDSEGHFQDLYYGPFSLDFGIRLLSFIRLNEMTKKPPLKSPAIYMPSRRMLRVSGPVGARLDQEVEEFGYESVARRLGLAYI